MVDKTAPREGLLTYVARVIVLFLIVLGVVLVVDAFTLFLLKLLTDVGTWLQVLLYEGAAMAFLGGVVWARAPQIWSRRRDPLIGVRMKSKYPWFWDSLGMTGITLLVLALYLFWRYY